MLQCIIIIVDDVMKKWVGIRDTFNKKKSAIDEQCASGAAPAPEPTWKWWKATFMA